MSTVLSRAAGSDDIDDDQRRPGWQAALIGVGWSAATVLVPLQLLVLVGWVVADTEAGPLDALAVGAYGWLLGHGVPIPLPDGTLSLHPLGLLLVVLVLLHRAGSWAARASAVQTLRGATELVATMAIGYGAVLTAVAAATLGVAAPANLAAAAGAGTLVALVGCGSGALRGAGLERDLRSRVPMDLRVALDAGAGAALVLLAGGALLFAASLAMHGSRAVGLTGAVAPGVSGWPLLLVLNLLLLPNAAVYAMSYAVGPGFSLGVDTAVSLGATEVGPLPSLALLAAVPEGGPTPPYAYAVLLVPLLAGVTAGLLAVVRAPGSRAEQAAVRGLCAGLVAGVLVGLLAWSAGGALGSGRLAVLGPTPWAVAGAVAVQVGIVAAVTAWVCCPRTTAVTARSTTAVEAPAPGAAATVASPTDRPVETAPTTPAPTSDTGARAPGPAAAAVSPAVPPVAAAPPAPASPAAGSRPDALSDGDEETAIIPRQAASG